MKSLWDERDAAACGDDELAMRVYTSRLLGASEDLVMHGGGNTSVKAMTKDFFGRDIEVLYVKGSGWDLKTIEKPGFPALALEDTRRLAELDSLSDPDMTRQLKAFMLDPTAPSPSVEAILHAIIPHKFIDHTHTDAIITLTNNPRGEELMAQLFPDCLVLPYIMPGFILSQQVYNALQKIDLADYRGIVLMHHGVFTFSEDAKTAYENMIELVTRAEDFIQEQKADQHATATAQVALLDLARIRKAVSTQRGAAQLAILDSNADAQGYASRPDVADIACRGPITPDHVIRTKRIPAILDAVPAADVPEVAQYAEDYRSYFSTHQRGDLQILDQAPRFGIWKNNGSIAFGSSVKECGIITDIARHTRWAIQTGEALGGWQALPAQDIFDLEYWVLEQAKLGKGGTAKAHQGKVALVTGAAGGIGYATCAALAADGATVVGIDVDPQVVSTLSAAGMTGIACDVTDEAAVQAAINQVVASYGGLDILVCNAGIFKAGETIEQHSDETWQRALDINLTATQRVMRLATPFLKLGVAPSIIVVGSRNFPAPGPGAAAYSVSKAGVTQLARVAALELAADGVRVNIVHPDAVFDTRLWTEEALQTSAQRYNMSVEEYQQKNLLGARITASDVGALISVMGSDVFAATTGAQIPIDGGNDRVV